MTSIAMAAMAMVKRVAMAVAVLKAVTVDSRATAVGIG